MSVRIYRLHKIRALYRSLGMRVRKFLAECPPWRKPSNDRDWSPDLQILPEILFSPTGESVTIRHIRNFIYRSVTDYTPGYYDRTFDLADVTSVWFMVEPFSLVVAHTLVSFGLKDGTFVTISVEVRKRRGESFSLSKVFFFIRRYEIVYVIGDEQDLIKLRSNYRQDQVYLYQAEATPEQAQALLKDMLIRAQETQICPEFYNPFTNTCLTNIISHVNTLDPKRVPWWRYEIVLAAYSDRLAYHLGLLDRSLPFRELKRRAYINERAHRFADDSDFSKRIRDTACISEQN